MEKKWNLQDIKPAEHRRSARPPRKIERSEAREDDAPAAPPRRARGERKRSWKGAVIGTLAVAAVAFVGLFAAALTGGATVTVHPKFREPTVNTIVEVARNATSSSDLAFEVLTLEATGEREVAATGQEQVEEQASGRITIYKTTPGSERLITNTRFQTDSGLVFRIKDPAVVPGATDEGPGSVTAEVFAEKPGAEYNLPAGTRLKVPGFKENNLNDLYDAIYAESPAEFSGGFVGPRFIIDEAELSAATDSLHKELSEALKGRVQSERPAGFVLFDSAIAYSYQELPSEDLGGGRVKLKQKATLHAPMFKNEDLAGFIGEATIPGFDHEPVRIEDPSVLSFEYAAPYDPGQPDRLSFKLVGKPRIIWTYDAEQLKKDIAGGAQTSLTTVLGGYPAIEKATAKIRPFWKQSFPDDPAKIAITEVVGAE